MRTTPFHALSIHEDGTTLSAAWLPENPSRLLLGLSCLWSEGAGVLLAAGHAAELANSLETGRSWFGPGMADGPMDDLADAPVRLTQSNRGDPYREGFDLAIRTDTWGALSLFLEEEEARRLAAFLRSAPSQES